MKHAIIPALLIGAGITLAPTASAAVQPGDSCSPTTDTISTDGTLSCSHQAGIWMHKGLPVVHLGDPCDKLGDVTYGPKESIVRCRTNGSGLTWQSDVVLPNGGFGGPPGTHDY